MGVTDPDVAVHGNDHEDDACGVVVGVREEPGHGAGECASEVVVVQHDVDLRWHGNDAVEEVNFSQKEQENPNLEKNN